MLSENIKNLRKKKGLSQEELSIKLNVVRQTVSKWEQGLSVPDADLLIRLSDALETPVSTLLGETVTEPAADDLKAVSERLEIINLQLARNKLQKRKALFWLFFALAALITAVFALLLALQSPYLNWNYSDPETAVAGTMLHAFEFIFVRTAPFALTGALIGMILTGRKVLPPVYKTRLKNQTRSRI